MFYICSIAFQAIFAFLIGTIVFDVFHYFFHLLLKSKHKFLRSIGSLHTAHHRFLNSQLKIDREWVKKNFYQHLLIEYGIKISAISACFLFLSHISVWIAIIFETIIFTNATYNRGIDARHKSYSILPSYLGGFLVTKYYHALHHVYPNYFFSSYFKILDFILGSAQPINGKRIALTEMGSTDVQYTPIARKRSCK